MLKHHRVLSLLLTAIAVVSLSLVLSVLLTLSPLRFAIADMEPPAVSNAVSNNTLLRPAPTLPIGFYDYFGKLLPPEEAQALVAEKGLDPNDPVSYQRIGAVEITPELLERGEDIFFNRDVGDMFGLQRVFGFQQGVTRLLPEYILAVIRQGFRPTTNLKLFALRKLELGDRTYYPGNVINTGFDLKRHGFRFRTVGDIFQSFLPIGLKLSGDITCAVCHVTLSPKGDVLDGVPNGDLNVSLLIALAPNTAAGFSRLDFDPLDPQYQGNGRLIIDSNDEIVELPDPEQFERAFDAEVLKVPQGNFESSPDRINNTTQIPSVFTLESGPSSFDGGFAIGPFGGLSAINNAVHSSEINLLAAAQNSAETLGLDPEVFLGILLQNAADPKIRLPQGDPVKPSRWLRQIAPELTQAELEDQIPAPGTGTYPFLRPSLFTNNGLVFTPDTGKSSDIASGPFLFANNAMSAWQHSLVPPPNRSDRNREALQSGSVKRGAKVFEQANCATCHIAPYFTDQKIYPVSQIGTNPARAISRLGIEPFLVPPKLYSFNTPVPVSSDAEVLDLPTEGISETPTSLPIGITPDGGYKTLSLRGIYLSAPYLHDGGVAVGADALTFAEDGSFTVTKPSRLGLSGTLSKGRLPDAVNSLHALVDRTLRAQVIAANKSDPALVSSNLDGTGHEFYVDKEAGFTAEQQRDLVNFLMSLDDDPGEI